MPYFQQANTEPVHINTENYRFNYTNGHFLNFPNFNHFFFFWLHIFWTKQIKPL